MAKDLSGDILDEITNEFVTEIEKEDLKENQVMPDLKKVLMHRPRAALDNGHSTPPPPQHATIRFFFAKFNTSC